MRINWKYAFSAQNNDNLAETDPKSRSFCGLFGLSELNWEKLGERALEQVVALNEGKGDCLDGEVKMLGWQKFADEISDEEIEKIEFLGKKMSDEVDIVWLIGIGGSYLGAKSVIEAKWGKNYNLSRKMNNGQVRPEIFFLGADTDADFLQQMIAHVEGKKLGLVVISKSGTTLEPALALRFGLKIIADEAQKIVDESGLVENEIASLSEIKRILEKQRVIAITDADQGALHDLAENRSWERLVIPRNIGGRFSVITAVGLLPMVMAGLDIRAYLEGVKIAVQKTSSLSWQENQAAQLAAWRYGLMQSGAVAEYQVTNYAGGKAVLNWVAQLEPESEGHEGQGVHVLPALFPRDLHSFGQLIQDGPRNCYEIAWQVASKQGLALSIPQIDGMSLDGLDEMSASEVKVADINQKVIDAALAAHFAAGVPSVIWEFDNGLDEKSLGEIQMILMKATAISGYLLGHNPFVQPGVQAWKKELVKCL